MAIRKAGIDDITKIINLIKNRFGNVENKSGQTIRSEMTNQEVVNALGYTPINSNNLLQNVGQYTEENPLVFKKNEEKEFSTIVELEAGKYYSLSFKYSGELYNEDEVSIVNFNEGNLPDAVDFIMSSEILLDNFYFKAGLTETYTFNWNRLSSANALDDLKIWDLKIVEGYSAEMLRTITDIKKSQKKVANLSIDTEKDVLVITLKG